ncbi:MAG: ferrous iron transport protein A [Verrucomicrobia bacterium]|nr:ferrous iron transport protein A [Verrucomicrobiota bacterium]MDE3098537.1 ferrous iron transport protein A [Verrucomicrobiota bacterium]
MNTARQTSANWIPLPDLRPRVCGIVRSVESDDEEALRLKALGVCAGRRVELVRRGDPVILKVFGTRLGLSAALASRVKVEICTPANCLTLNAENP